MNTVTFTADSLQAEAVLRELGELAELFPEVVNSLVDLPPGISQLITIDTDSAAPLAGNVRVLFKPSDFLLGCVATLRAFQRQGVGNGKKKTNSDFLIEIRDQRFIQSGIASPSKTSPREQSQESPDLDPQRSD